MLARHEQHQMTQVRIIVWYKAKRRGLREDLSAIVDIKRSSQLISGARLNQGVQIHHGSTVFPQERVQKILAIG